MSEYRCGYGVVVPYVDIVVGVILFVLAAEGWRRIFRR